MLPQTRRRSEKDSARASPCPLIFFRRNSWQSARAPDSLNAVATPGLTWEGDRSMRRCGFGVWAIALGIVACLLPAVPVSRARVDAPKASEAGYLPVAPAS